MELTDRQKLTIEHLKEQGIEKPSDIIKFCLLKLPLRQRLGSKRRHKQTRPFRKHSIQHYQGIIDYLSQDSVA